MTWVPQYEHSYDNLLGWLTFAVNQSMDQYSPVDIATALRELADECDKTLDGRWVIDYEHMSWTRKSGSDFA